MSDNEHIGLDTLSDHAEGLLPDAAETGVVAHLADCAECTARLHMLEDVSTILAAEPPPTLPGDIAARLDAAIAHESADRARHASEATAEPATGPGRATPAPVVPLRGRSGRQRDPNRRGGRLMRPLAAAAAAVVIAGGAGFLAHRQISGDGTGDTSGIAGRRNEQTRIETDTTFLRSGTRYTKANLSDKATELAGTATSPGPSRHAMHPEAAARGCLPTVSKRAGVVGPPVFVDSARYAGAPATVIAYRLSPQRLGVWVVKGTCRAGAPIITHVRADEPR